MPLPTVVITATAGSTMGGITMVGSTGLRSPRLASRRGGSSFNLHIGTGFFAPPAVVVAPPPVYYAPPMYVAPAPWSCSHPRCTRPQRPSRRPDLLQRRGDGGPNFGNAVGGALGGYLGSQIGRGSGQLAATAAGAVMGYALVASSAPYR